MRSNWNVDRVHQIVSALAPERLASWRAVEDRPRAAGAVDIATGHVVFADTDYQLAGPPALGLRRTYDSGWSHRASVLGGGWSLSVDQAIWLEPGGVVWRDGDGRELLFEHAGEVGPGLQLRTPLDPARLSCISPGAFRMRDRRGRILEFETGSGGSISTLRTITRGKRSAWITHDQSDRPISLRSGTHQLQLIYEGGRLALVRLVNVRDEAFEVARYEYDSAGRLSRARGPHGADRSYTYAAGLLVSRTDRSGVASYFGYDSTGRDARCVRTWSDGGYGDRRLRYRHGATTVIDGIGASHPFEFDPLLRPTKTPHGTISYDPVQLSPTRFQGPDGHLEALLDAHGRAGTVERSDGSKEYYAYDELGRVVRFMDAGGTEEAIRYGAAGEPVERSSGDSQTLVRTNERGATELVLGDEWLEVERDGGDRVTRVLLRDEAWSVRYDELGRPAALRSPDGECGFEHNAYGHLGAMVMNGVRTSFARDGEGRLRRARLPDGDWEVERDAGGLPRLVSRPDFACELRFDSERRLTELRDRRGRRWLFERDRSGRVIEEVDFDGRVHRYGYIGTTRTTASVVEPTAQLTSATRDRGGRVVEARYGKAMVDRFTYDRAGRLITAERDGWHTRLTRDRRGAVILEEQGRDGAMDEVGVQYDARGRRRSVVSSLGARILSSWGAKGDRRLEIAAPDGSRHELRLDRRFLSADALRVPRAPDRPPVRFSAQGEVERDALGRVVAWTGPEARRYAYAYGADGLLSEIALPSGETLQYHNDPFGRRVMAATEQWQARWVWDGEVALHELSTHAPPTLFVFDPSDRAPVGKVQPGATRWLGLYQDFVSLFDPAAPDRPTTEYWPWRGGLQIDFLTGLWLGAGRAFHPRAAEPMGASALIDELFGPAARRPFTWQPRVVSMLDRASDASIERFLHRLTTPPCLDLARTPPTPWPEAVAPPAIVPRDLDV